MIRAFIGRFGSGKTLSMVADAQRYVREGYTIITNNPFTASVYKRHSIREIIKTRSIGHFERPQPILVTTLDQLFSHLYKAERTLFVLDEAGAWISSYKWDKLPDEVYQRILQVRKVKIHVLYTTQRFKFVAKRIREITDNVVQCNVIFRGKNSNTVELDGKPFMIRQIQYDPEYFDQKIYSLDVEKKYIMKRSFLFGKKLQDAMNSFDTTYIV